MLKRYNCICDKADIYNNITTVSFTKLKKLETNQISTAGRIYNGNVV